jgi:hypothetical protein
MAGGRDFERHATSRRQAETDALLRESIRASGLEGKPLNLQSMPFAFNRDAAIAGMLGPPAWVVRLKEIHEGRTALTAQLDAAWGAYARRYRTAEEFARRWRAYVDTLDLAPLNTLIEKHNEYYPIEARLPIVWPTGEYRVPTGIEHPQQPVTVEQVLDQYPADRDIALHFSKE